MAVVAAVLTLASSSHNAPTLSTTAVQLENLSSQSQFAHLSTAKFALVAPGQVMNASSRFVSLASQYYNFQYASASNFSAVENAPFLVIVANASYPSYISLALDAVNGSTLDYALNNTDGVILSGKAAWASNQTVFVLAGYNSTSSVSSALLSFFVKVPVRAPKQLAASFMAVNGTSNSIPAPKDPILDAYLNGAYELGPHDTSLIYPYNYYEEFAYLLYYAPVFDKYVIGFHGNTTGLGLPSHAMICVPPPPPPGGASICIGEYVAMPMFQFGSTPPQQPQFDLKSSDCSFFGTSDCIDAEGWAASGLNPSLPYQSVPSIYYGFTKTGSDIPPSMSGTTGPVADSLPITWWIYGPGTLGESTGGMQSSIMDQNETQLLLDSGVQMFSVPIGETPEGSFQVYNSTNASSTYSCSSNYCGMRFNYSIYALMTESSTIPQGATVLFPYNYSQATQSGYYAALQPVTLTTPKVVKTYGRTYYFSYWSVYTELAGSQYYRRFNTSNATFQLIGPTQAQAIYTWYSTPGSVTIHSEYMMPSTYITCPPPLNCSLSAAVRIPYVNVSLIGPGGAIVYTNTTGANGIAVTPILPGNCYQLSAQRSGYSFLLNPNPVCVNGATYAAAVDTGPFVFDISWPHGYPYAGAPAHSRIPINLTLLYTSGNSMAAGDIPVLASAGSGSITPEVTTSQAGTASFIWQTGNSSGIYYINFTTSGVFDPPQTYQIPVVVYSSNYSRVVMNVSLSNSFATVAAGGSFTDNVTVRICGFAFNLSANGTLSCTALNPASMSVIGLPYGSSYSFNQNPVTANQTMLVNHAVLHATLPGNVSKGIHSVYVMATVESDNTTYTASAPLSINVSVQSPSSGGSGTNSSVYGEIDGSVFFNGKQAIGAEVSALPGHINGWYTNVSGEFNTGYTMAPGNYEVIASYDNISNSTGYTAVTEGEVSTVHINLYNFTTTTTTSTSSTTTAEGYYACDACSLLYKQGFVCPQSCPQTASCGRNGFECIT